MKVKCGDGQSGKKSTEVMRIRQRWVLFFNGIKYWPVILERT